MNMWKSIGLGAAIIAAAVGLGTRFFGTNRAVDEKIENVAEKVIESQTGIKVDFDSSEINPVLTDTTKSIKS